MNLFRMLASLTALMSLACGVGPAEAGVIDRATLQKMSTGATAKFSGLTTFDAGTVCMLLPYQDRLDSSNVVAQRVNEHLTRMGFTSDEGHFSYVMIGKDAIEVQTLKRSRQLDAMARHEVSGSIQNMLPKGFMPGDCVNSDVAAVTKIEFRDRPYVILGEMR